MADMIFVNLPVQDLPRSRRFFEGLGLSFNEQFSDQNAACLILSETSFAMLLTAPYFGGFSTLPVADTQTTTGAILGLQVESRAEVDRIADTALANGGRPATPPADHGYMYGRSFLDPDGHHWSPFYMDMEAAPAS